MENMGLCLFFFIDIFSCRGVTQVPLRYKAGKYRGYFVNFVRLEKTVTESVDRLFQNEEKLPFLN